MYIMYNVYSHILQYRDSGTVGPRTFYTCIERPWWDHGDSNFASRVVLPLGGRELMYLLYPKKGGGPRVVVSTAAFHARVRGSVPGLGGLKETKCFFPIHV